MDTSKFVNITREKNIASNTDGNINALERARIITVPNMHITSFVLDTTRSISVQVISMFQRHPIITRPNVSDTRLRPNVTLINKSVNAKRSGRRSLRDTTRDGMILIIVVIASRGVTQFVRNSPRRDTALTPRTFVSLVKRSMSESATSLSSRSSALLKRRLVFVPSGPRPNSVTFIRELDIVRCIDIEDSVLIIRQFHSVLNITRPSVTVRRESTGGIVLLHLKVSEFVRSTDSLVVNYTVLNMENTPSALSMKLNVLLLTSIFQRRRNMRRSNFERVSHS